MSDWEILNRRVEIKELDLRRLDDSFVYISKKIRYIYLTKDLKQG
jgi:hypothetical protein